MNSASVSVIVPAYNAVESLPHTLESIAAQTLKPLEILVCDDGSRDGTWAYLEGLGDTFKGIHLRCFQQPNQGAGAARNRCLKAARGTYVAFLDADDLWLPEKLARSIAELEANHYIFVAHNFQAAVPEGKPVVWDCVASAYRKTWPARDIETHYFYRGFIGILTVVIRRDALLAAGGFDSEHRYMLDWECWHAVLATQRQAQFGLFADNLAHYTLNPKGLTSKGFDRLKDRETFLVRHVRHSALRGRLPWCVLLLRGWLTVQAETALLLIKQRQWFLFGKLIMRAPFVLVKLVIKTLCTPHYTRKNYLDI